MREKSTVQTTMNGMKVRKLREVVRADKVKVARPPVGCKTVFVLRVLFELGTMVVLVEGGFGERTRR